MTRDAKRQSACWPGSTGSTPTRLLADLTQGHRICQTGYCRLPPPRRNISLSLINRRILNKGKELILRKNGICCDIRTPYFSLFRNHTWRPYGTINPRIGHSWALTRTSIDYCTMSRSGRCVSSRGFVAGCFLHTASGVCCVRLIYVEYPRVSLPFFRRPERTRWTRTSNIHLMKGQLRSKRKVNWMR